MYVLLLSCTSPKRLYNKERYDSVIRFLDNKAIKGTLEEEEVEILTKSVNAKLEEERILLGDLFKSKEVKDWKEGYTSLDDVVKMQKEFSTFSQLDLNQISWINIEKWDKKFSNLLYDYHVDAYESLYENYIATENKNYIIDAYYELDNISHFDRGEINIDSLQAVFAKEGVRKIEFDFQDKSFNAYELRHLRYYVNPANNIWSDFSIHSNPDYSAYIILDDLDKDDNRASNQRVYTDDIIIDYQIQTDAQGNETEVPITETLEALVNEIVFRYTVEAEIRVDIYWNKTKELVRSQTFRELRNADIVETYMLAGDERAIPLGVNLSRGNPRNTAFNFNYDNLVEETLRVLSNDAQAFLEEF